MSAQKLSIQPLLCEACRRRLNLPEPAEDAPAYVRTEDPAEPTALSSVALRLKNLEIGVSERAEAPKAGLLCSVCSRAVGPLAGGETSLANGVTDDPVPVVVRKLEELSVRPREKRKAVGSLMLEANEENYKRFCDALSFLVEIADLSPEKYNPD